MVNKRRLEREGKKWVEAEIISEKQLQAILAKYVKEDKSYILIILAALLISISIIIFIFSDWAQIPNVFKILVMLIIMIALYLYGFKSFNQKRLASPRDRSKIIGISFIMLGYILFGATLFLTLYMYNVNVFSAWPFIAWSVVGLSLYVITPNHYLFVLALLLTIYGQIHSAVYFSSFNYIIFFIFFIGYFHYVFHRGNMVSHYTFAIGLMIQLFILSMIEIEQFYWFSFFVLVMYALGLVLPKKLIGERFLQISVIAILVYKIYETMAIQEDYILENLKFQPSFFILHVGLLIAITILLWLTKREELITIVLFIPLFYLPYAHVLIIIMMFIYSIYLLIFGFQKRESNKVMLGMLSFLLSTFTVIVQYAWETLNKSLFFLIAGLILFFISMIIERKRRTEVKGGDE